MNAVRGEPRPGVAWVRGQPGARCRRCTATVVIATVIGAVVPWSTAVRADPAPAPAQVAACAAGATDCPIELHMRRGATTVTVSGRFAADQAECSYRFAARAQQQLRIRVSGESVKTSAGIALFGPEGDETLVDADAPFRLERSGRYRLRLARNTMSEQALAPFALTVEIR